MSRTAVIHTLPECPWCHRAKALLEHFPHVEVQQVTGKHEDWKTVPYIILDGEPLGGFTELANYVRDGKLKQTT